MRFERAVARITRELFRNDPGCAHEILQRVGHARFASGLSGSFNWKVKVFYCGPISREWDEDVHGDGEEFVMDMLCHLIRENICPMCVSFYKSAEDEPYYDVFECMFDTARGDYKWVYDLFNDDDNLVVVQEIPWQDFCDVRRQMCSSHEYYFWNVTRYNDDLILQGYYDCFSYLLGPYPALTPTPAPAA